MIKFSLANTCRGRLHCTLCRKKLGDGAKFRGHVIRHLMEDLGVDFECPQGFKWDAKIEPEAEFVFQGVISNGQLSEQSAPSMPTKEDVERVRQRFEICKTCDKATEGGHKCSLHKACCFGAWRSDPESKCYEGKW